MLLGPFVHGRWLLSGKYVFSSPEVKQKGCIPLHLFPQKYFPYEKKKVADEMVEKIRDEFRIMLEELDWMDPEVGGDDGLDQR